MLLQNKSFLACNGLRYLAGAPAVSGVLSRNDLGGTINTKRNRYIGEANMYKGDSIPSGYSPTGGAWYPNRIAGGMGSRYQVIGYGSISAAALAGGFNISVLPATMTGYGTITTRPYLQIADHFIVDVASLTSAGTIKNTSKLSGIILFKESDPVVLTGEGTIPDVMLRILAWSIATLEGEGTVTGVMQAPVLLSATLLSEGEISYAALIGMVYLMGSLTGEGVLDPSLRFPANLSSVLEGEGTIPETLLKAIAWCVTDILASGTATGSTLRGDGFMDAHITSAGELVTAQSCAAAVWNALASAYNASGSMGQAMGAAGSAGDPWITELPGPYTGDQAGKLLSELGAGANPWEALLAENQEPGSFGEFLQKLLTTAKFLGLK